MKTIKKAKNGIVKDSTKTYQDSPFQQAKQDKEKKKVEYKKFTSSRGSVSVGGNPKLDDKPKVKYVPTKKQAKNIKDATQMKNMRPVFKSGGKSMKKCKYGCN
jgi:hypothetical protein